MRLINSPDIAPALGPYSHAVIDGDHIYCSGQLPLDPQGRLVSGGVAEQTNQAFKNIREVLEACGSDTHGVLKVTVYMTDLGEFATLNELYAKFFGTHRPARTTVQISKLPLGASVEIDVIAKILNAG
ncbi:RidA family protein [Herminiimonas sp. NPDC097707]|uniref:RidA family protein n=1 Tax=Herminiimonas sp. NPDC097707 TaxID=3364007 RepID=UPI00383BE756